MFIDLNSDIKYLSSSLRYFDKKERHVSRVCQCDILLLVFDGILRFSEDGVEYEVGANEYFIQKRGGVQLGKIESDSPKYLYVHFLGSWCDENTGAVLPRRGTFSYHTLRPLIEGLNSASHSDAPYIDLAERAYRIFLSLCERTPIKNSLAGKIAAFIEKEYSSEITLDTLVDMFHFSKNHIINLFKEEFSVSPITFLNITRLKNAEYRLEVTNDPLENIAEDCGYQNYSHFYKQFMKKNGISPTKWRQEKRLGNI